MWTHRKKLDDDQLHLLLAKEVAKYSVKKLKAQDASKPLFLIVACEELRVFGVFEKVSERIREMAGTVSALFEEVLRRIESEYDDRTLPIDALSFLACSRGIIDVNYLLMRLGGLLETEMLHLLSADNDPLPQLKWARLYRSLKNYLRPPGT